MTPYYYRHLRDFVARLRRRVLYMACNFMPQMPYGKRVMVVAPHPDDETFGAGAYICSLLAKGSKVRVVVVSSGGQSLGENADTPEVERQRERLCRQATSILGLGEEDVIFLRQPDGNVLAGRKDIEQLRCEIELWEPDILLSPGLGEVWPDHVNTAIAVMQIASEKCRVYHYWVWTWYYNTMPRVGRMYYNIDGRTYGDIRRKAVDVYLKSKRYDGNILIGKLPQILIECVRQDREIFCYCDRIEPV